MALPIAINRARFAPPGKRGVRWTQVGLIGAALPMTVSRSAVLAVLAVAFVLLPTWPKIERRIAYVVMALGVAGLWFLVPGLIGTFRTLFATLTGDTSTTSRTSAFTNAMPYIPSIRGSATASARSSRLPISTPTTSTCCLSSR